MSELTDWERHRLAALERQLSLEDPELAARLAGRLDHRRLRVTGRIGWALIWVGAVLLMCGAVLGDGFSLVLGLLTLTCGPALLWWARATARRSRPGPTP